MRYKHITTVGSALVSIFAFLAASSYYFNEGTCSKGTILCPNSSSCIEQNKFCNGHDDCPSGFDENITNCADVNGPFDAFTSRDVKLKTFDDNITSKIVCPPIPEDDPRFIKCRYTYTTKHCGARCNQFDGDISQMFLANITTLTITNNVLHTLEKGYLDRYYNLRTVYFINNTLKYLKPKVFENQGKLIELIINENNIEEVSVGHLVGLKNLDLLDLNFNKIHTLNLQDLENSEELVAVLLQQNLLTDSNISFPTLPALKELDIGSNLLKVITDKMFENLSSLASLTLDNNQIESISPLAFKNQKNLIDISLMYNKILEIDPRVFKPLKALQNLKLGHNYHITKLEDTIFPVRDSVVIIGLEEIDLFQMKQNFFNDFPLLRTVYFKRFHYCTAFAPKVRYCSPPMDGVSSLKYLLGTSLVRSAVWGISCLTCLGNALVLWGRFTARDENAVLSILIRNLAVSDLLMGIYLFIVGLEDLRFENKYKDEAGLWMTSWSCTFLGMLAMISSEVSVLILMFISIERYVLISAPLKGKRPVTPRFAKTSMFVIWLLGLTFAVFPVINWLNSTARFYGQNGMCFPLHIDDPFLLGWEYSAFIFLGINLLGLLTIGFAYVGMFISVWKTRHATSLSTVDSEFALRFFLIVMTDAICWVPIIVLKILALANYTVGSELHSWIVVFILPINSAVNPLLYTFTTPKFRERVKEWWFGIIRKAASKKQSRSDSQISNTIAHTSFDKDLDSTSSYKPNIQVIFLKLHMSKDNVKF